MSPPATQLMLIESQQPPGHEPPGQHGCPLAPQLVHAPPLQTVLFCEHGLFSLTQRLVPPGSQQPVLQVPPQQLCPRPPQEPGAVQAPARPLGQQGPPQETAFTAGQPLAPWMSQRSKIGSPVRAPELAAQIEPNP